MEKLNKKLNKEILQERSNRIHNNEYLILGEYVNSSTKIEIRHLVCDRINYILPNNHLSGKRCGFCFGTKRKTTEEFQLESNIKYNSSFLIISDYINANEKIKIKHLICGSEFETLPKNHLNTKFGCSVCSNTKKLTKEIIQERSNKIHNYEYLVISEYINCEVPIIFKHIKCGSESYQTPSSHLAGHRCVVCFGTPRMKSSEFQTKSNTIHNNEYELISEYKNMSTEVIIKHLKCGYIFSQLPTVHLKGHGCPCNTRSKGETKIEENLTKLNIKFESEVKFEGCKNIYPLHFDFYLPDYNLCIEYDGIQHFESIEWFGGDKALKENKIRDEIKNKWCKDNGVKLTRISYKENIEDKLKQIFNIY